MTVLPEPYPPGQEIATVDNADRAHGGNVAVVDVKEPGGEMARVWPDGTLPGMPGTGAPPAASFTCTPPNPVKNTTVTLDGSGSVPGSAFPITRYDWVLDTASQDDAGPVVTWRTPNKSGSYTITLTVTDSGGVSGSSAMVITY